MKKEKISPTKEQIECPICKGPVNNLWFDPSSSTEIMASFICECWSGDLERDSEHHLFRVKVFDLPVLEIVE